MHPVRSITTALLILTITVYASADGPATVEPGDSGFVELSIAESVEMHGSREDITRICRSARGVKGCTDFPVERLSCACEKHGEVWLIDARAEIEAVIHLSARFSGNRVLMHERTHLEDLELGLRNHLSGIASRPYASEKACKIYAKVLTQSPHLRVTMNELRVKSNEKYGCDGSGGF